MIVKLATRTVNGMNGANGAVRQSPRMNIHTRSINRKIATNNDLGSFISISTLPVQPAHVLLRQQTRLASPVQPQ